MRYGIATREILQIILKFIFTPYYISIRIFSPISILAYSNILMQNNFDIILKISIISPIPKRHGNSESVLISLRL
jgi:hypothetical protein